MTDKHLNARMHLYQTLADALAEPPDWLSSAGHRWALFTALVEMAEAGVDDKLPAFTFSAILTDLVAIPPEPQERRRERYSGLIASLYFYESQARDGRLAGPTMFLVQNAYFAAGLKSSGTELPDHVSVELAFLAFLIEQELAGSDAGLWKKARQLFIKHHAMHWIPQLGEALKNSHDLVYKPIGQLLSYAIRSETHSARKPKRPASALRPLPELAQPDLCNLCGFCVQVCPTRALKITETDDLTQLSIHDMACVGCSQCVKQCSCHVLDIKPGTPAPQPRSLRQSPRVHCQRCQQPLVSQAEMDAIAARIGNVAWLNYCPSCRLVMERI